MKRINREKRNIGGAVRRAGPSKAATLLTQRGLVKGTCLDFGCGFGTDADLFGWEKYDPFYFPRVVSGPYQTIVCINVLNAIIRKRRAEALRDIQSLLAEDGVAYLAVARNIPVSGKMCDMKRAQHYVQLNLPLVHEDKRFAIYSLRKNDSIVDSTKDFLNF